MGTKNLVDAIIDSNIKWFFFSSTSHVYKSRKKKKKISENSIKKPISYYGKTKFLAEKYIIKNLGKKNDTVLVEFLALQISIKKKLFSS